jgi:hypothetical protein
VTKNSGWPEARQYWAGSTFLRKLGFTPELHEAEGSILLLCHDLPGIAVGVSLGKSRLATDSFSLCQAFDMTEAKVRSMHDSPKTNRPVILWKPKDVRRWRLTWLEKCGLVTVAAAPSIGMKLIELGGGDPIAYFKKSKKSNPRR